MCLILISDYVTTHMQTCWHIFSTLIIYTFLYPLDFAPLHFTFVSSLTLTILLYSKALSGIFCVVCDFYYILIKKAFKVSSRQC